MKVLVVDDELLIRRSLEKVFISKACEVLSASDGDEGLRQWQTHHPDLVILDVLMPKMGGVEVLNKIHRHEPDLLKAVVIMVSAYSAGGTKDEFIKLGANDFVRKPFENVHKFVDECLANVGESH